MFCQVCVYSLIDYLWSSLGKQVIEQVCAEDGAPKQLGPLNNLDSHDYKVFTLVVLYIL